MRSPSRFGGGGAFMTRPIQAMTGTSTPRAERPSSEPGTVNDLQPMLAMTVPLTTLKTPVAQPVMSVVLVMTSAVSLATPL